MTGTKLLRVDFAGGLAVDVAVPLDQRVLVQEVVSRAVEVVRRYFRVGGEPRVLGVDATRTVPGRVELRVAPPPSNLPAWVTELLERGGRP